MDNRDWIVLDTETTGFDPSTDRIIEIGAVRIRNRIITEEVFHAYLQPDRSINPSAVAVHGITEKFLKDKPRFKDIADDFLAWIDGGVIVIHNAPFDVGFLDMELRREGMDPLHSYIQQVVDTLTLARKMHRGKKNDLNTLLNRYNIDNSERVMHGALLDAQLLAQLFMRMTQCQEQIAYDAFSAERFFDSGDVLSRDKASLHIDTTWVQ